MVILGMVYEFMAVGDGKNFLNSVDSEVREVREPMAILAHLMSAKKKGEETWKNQWCTQIFPNGYGSIPINTIFRGMNIHFTSYFDVHQGYKVLTHCQNMAFGQIPGVLGPWRPWSPPSLED